ASAECPAECAGPHRDSMSRLFRDVEGGPRCPHGSVVCIGAFDGLHLGHQALVRRTVQRARELDVPAVALSFEPLPREFFAKGNPPPRLLLPHAKVERLSAREVWVGPEFRFGKGRSGDIAMLRRVGTELGFAADEIAPVELDGERVSSTRIRIALQSGDFAGAARLLGRPYSIGGHVVRGKRLGRELGFPTANIRFAGKMPALSG